MNRVCLIGRLTGKPELKYTNTNLPFTRFSLAVNRTFNNAQGQRETDFISITVWRRQAENICQYLDKGSQISIEGRIQTGSYDDKDGSKRYTTDVVADNVQFLESKSQNMSRSQNTGYEPQSQNSFDYQDATPVNDVDVNNDPFADFGDSVSIDDNFLD